MGFRKISAEIISALLTVILLCGNLFSCAKSESAPVSRPDEFTGISADRFIAPETDGAFIAYDAFNDAFLEIIDDEFIETLLDKYQADIDDIFISLITIDEYDDLIARFYSQPGIPLRELDINRVVTNLAIGAAIVLICVALPALAPGMAPAVVAILTAAPQAALIGAAVDAAVSGVISYVKNDGDLEAVLYDSIEAGAEGFKWGAVFAAGTAAFTSARLAAQAARAEKQAGRLARARNQNFSAAAERGRTARTVINQADDALGMSYKSLVEKYGKTLADDIQAWKGGQYTKIQARLRGEPFKAEGVILGQKLKGAQFIEALDARTARLNKFLGEHSISRPMTLLRGENLPRETLERLYNIHIGNEKDIKKIAGMIKAGGKTPKSPGLTSTSMADVQRYIPEEMAIYGWGEGGVNNFKVIRELRAPAGTKGFNVSQIGRMRGQREFLMPSGLQTEVTGVKIEKVVMNGESYDVMRIIEEIIP